MPFYPPAPRYGLHPYWPERLGFRKVLKIANPRLERLLRQTDGYTLVAGRNRTTLYREAKSVLDRGVGGDFAEIGVHRGGSAAVLAALLRDEPGRDLHLFDRWGDLPEPTREDGHRQEEYRKANIADKLAVLREDPPLEATRQIVEETIGMPSDRLHYRQGWYEDSFAAFEGDARFAFVSLDCDYYRSVRDSFAFLKDRMAAGATIVIDDYGTWPGARQATDEFVAANPSRVQLIPLPIGTAVLRFAG